MLSFALTLTKRTDFHHSRSSWTPSIPKGWKMASVRNTCKVLTGGTPSKDELSYWNEGDINWLCSGDVNLREIHDVKHKITTKGLQNSNARWLPKGSVIIALNGQGKTKGMVATLEIASTCNQSLACIVPPRTMSYRYLYYYLLSNYANIRGLVGEARDGLNLNHIKSILLPIPPKKEQDDISAFLYSKCTLIDKAIEAKKKQIELLKEKRANLINQAVTRGIDDNVEMKDSGVEWIGKIPSHWKNWKISHLCKLGRGRVIAQQDMVDGGRYPIYSSQTKNNGVLGYLDQFDYNGDYLTWTTDGAYAGTVSFRSGKFNCTNVCGTLKPIKDISLKFLSYGLSVQTKRWVREDINPKLMNNVMASIKVPIPPKEEQQRIATLLDVKTKKIDQTVSLVTRSISLLEEYKISLISNVVTGIIKV